MAKNKKSIPHYVDGYVLAVPKRKMNTYRRIAQQAGKIWRKYGALDYKECVADDVNTKYGISFPKMFKPKPGETVVFSYVVFKSRAHRDSVNAKVMKEMMNDPAMAEMTDMPFDTKRMVYGGFKILVDA